MLLSSELSADIERRINDPGPRRDKEPINILAYVPRIGPLDIKEEAMSKFGPILISQQKEEFV